MGLLSNRSESWQEHRQHCWRCAGQISKWCDHLNYQYRGFETSRDRTVRRLIRYWNGAPEAVGWDHLHVWCWFYIQTSFIGPIVSYLLWASFFDHMSSKVRKYKCEPVNYRVVVVDGIGPRPNSRDDQDLLGFTRVYSHKLIHIKTMGKNPRECCVVFCDEMTSACGHLAHDTPDGLIPAP